MNTRVETGYPLDNHRTTPVPAFAQFARAVHDSPNIDYMWLWDELSGWFPGKLWTTENTPAADFIDGDSTYDPFVQAAIALAHNPDANIRLSTDAIRGGPAELLRKVLTLSNATSGNVVVAVGAGELRQTKPFGYKRTEGLQRLEDILQLVRRLYDEPQPWTQETNFWHLKNATIGKHRPEKRPEFWALGGGPVLLEIAARYADGFEAATPQAIQTPEEFSETVEAMRKKVKGYGRDPDAFGFGIWSLYVCHEDPEVIDRVLANPIVRYFAGQFGRLDQKRWLNEGETPVMPDGWHYAVKWAPFEQTDEEIQRIVDATPVSMSRKAYHVGTPKEMAKLHSEFVEAGAQFVGWLDMTPLALGPLEGPESLRRANEISGLIRQATGVGV
jgi:phthiodiolone/phenolphthiodiolone dimycocerosates ketoreductase